MSYSSENVTKGSLEVIRLNANRKIVCGAIPTTRAEALSYELASANVAVGDFSYSLLSGVGWQLAMAGTDNVLITTSGELVCIATISATELLAVHDVVMSEPLTQSGTIDIPEILFKAKFP